MEERARETPFDGMLCDGGSKGLKEEVAKKEKFECNGHFLFLLLMYFLILLSI